MINEAKFKKDQKEQWGERGLLRAEYVLLLEKQPINAQITLVLNRDAMSLISLRRYLGKWIEWSERDLIGSRFYKKPAEKRIQGFFFAEKMGSNAHLHGLLVLPHDWVSTPAHILGATAAFDDAWSKLVPSGNIKLNTSAAAICGAIYQTKEFKRQDFWGEMMMATDFWAASRTGALPGRGSRR